MMIKYDDFFNESKDFFKSLGWAVDTSFIGLSLQEIREIEEVEGIKITGGFLSYLQNFGKKGAARFFRFQFNLRTMREVKEAEEEWNMDLEDHEKANWLQEISTALEKKGLYNRDVKPILLFDGLEGGVIYFTLERQDEFELYYYNHDQAVCRPNVYDEWLIVVRPYLQSFRSYLYNALMLEPNSYWNKFQIAEHNRFFNKEIINKIPWLRFYKETERRLRKKQTHGIRRDRFQLIAHEREKKMGRFMGIDEFEVECIKYLIETGEVEAIPEVFDPYGEFVTFYDYLKK